MAPILGLWGGCDTRRFSYLSTPGVVLGRTLLSLPELPVEDWSLRGGEVLTSHPSDVDNGKLVDNNLNGFIR